jgi:endonuclease/exonuclease/phosphatase family metal-dependent hydrolase
MRIISWNLRNIGHAKLARRIAPVIAAANVGNTVLDFIVKVVMGGEVWQPIASAAPADIFVMIELRSGGMRTGAPVSGTAVPTLRAVIAAMNSVAPSSHQYDAIIPVLTGSRECVGIIYNKLALTPQRVGVLPDNLNHALVPRTPFAALFTVQANNAPLLVVGIHAPPPRGVSARAYENPIRYCQKLATVPQIAATTNAVVVGDFNCAPDSSFPLNGAPVQPFTALPNYQTQMNNNSLTSVRVAMDPTLPAPADYLYDYYDNILYQEPGTSAKPKQYVMDLIGNNPLFADQPLDVMAAYRQVSDHLPVVLEA